MRTSTWFIFAFVVSISSGCAAARLETRVEVHDPEYEVYSTVLDSLFIETARGAYLVPASTGRWGDPHSNRDFLSAALRRMAGTSDTLIQSFERANATRSTLNPQRFRTRVPVILLDSVQVEEMSQLSGEWDGYPEWVRAHGLVVFSAVGFSADMQHALVSVQWHCGGLCGDVSAIRLQRRGGRWIIVAHQQALVA